MLLSRQKIGLALGGGGPKGLAHIGVIKTLEKYGVPIDYIAGTSAGSLIGGFYALNKDIASIEKYVMDKNWLQVLSYFADPTFKSGIFQGNRLEGFLDGYLHDAKIEDTKIPFAAVATDLRTAKKIELKSGSLTKSIRASCAMPVVFKPVEIGKYLLTDGAVLSPVPVETVKKMGADIVIAVQLYNDSEENGKIGKANFVQVAEESFSIMARRIANDEIKKADILVYPDVSKMEWRSLLKQDAKIDGIQCGIQIMEKNMGHLNLLMKKSSLQRFFQHILGGN